MRSCSLCLKKLVKVELSEGGSVQLDFFLKGEILLAMLLQKKYCVSMRVLNLLQDLFISCLKVFVEVGTKDKTFVRTTKEKICIYYIHI